MDGAKLSELIEQRREVLTHLLELGGRQVSAIASGRMSELMQILSEKQAPLEELAEISRQLRPAADDDPALRAWSSEADRRACRSAQDECEQMHIELLAIEAQCETSLSESRTAVAEKLSQLDSAHQAANQYASSQATPTVGARLDLSSD